MKTYKKQASKILDLSKIELKYNSTWLSKLNFDQITKIASNFTVAQMLERDMFQKRIQKNKPISLHEFLYPLMQGYDSVALSVDLEIGGNDQMFNMLAGRTLQKNINNQDKHVLTMKLLPGTNGKKMSKTANNFIPLQGKPNDVYGKIMSMPDKVMKSYFELVTRIDKEEIKEILANDPRQAKARLAQEIVTLLHGKTKASQAEKHFNQVFKQKKLPNNIKTYKAKNKNQNILELLKKTKLCSSKSEAKRLIKQKGIKINKKPIENWHKKITLKSGDIIQRGKRRFVKLKLP